MNHKRFLTILLILTLGLALLPAQTAQAATYTVNTTADEHDGSCSDGDCSLRDAIIIANTNPGIDTIEFALPGCPPVCTISPTSPLPALTGGGTIIDGYSQDGALPADHDSQATLMVVIDGSLAGTSIYANGIGITSADNVVRGLIINRFAVNGIAIAYSSTTRNSIQGNYIGTDASGTLDRGNGASGVYIGLGATNNTVGGDQPAERNLLSGNEWSGVEIHSNGTNGNVVTGNYIGTTDDGVTALGNTLYGVRVYGGAQNNTIGPGNLISGNGINGVRIAGAGTNGNVVLGNFIGTTPNGAAALGNAEDGVYITLGAQSNTIGGDSASERNIISGNLASGVVITGTDTMSNTISGNVIGLDASGAAALGNAENGVQIEGGAQANVIGGSAPGERNIISGNEWSGVALRDSGTLSNTISGNYIGTNTDGTAALGNSRGITIFDGVNNLIGGTQPGQGNLISGNDGTGIVLIDLLTTGNVIAGNLVGTDATGATGLGNAGDGIDIRQQAHDNTIGPGNVISANGQNGIVIGIDVSGTTIFGNFIGTDATGMADLGNTLDGIELVDGAQDNTIGGDTETERNVISGNDRYGVVIEGAATQGITVSGNYIGVDASGATDLGNGDDGVSLVSNAQGNIIGGDTVEERNVISGNGDEGVALDGANDNTVSANFIGTDASGTAALANDGFGIYIGSGAQNNTVGGTTPSERNVISASGRDGLYIAGSDTTGNVILGNIIGADASGMHGLGNGEEGIELDVGANGNTIGPGNVVAYNDFSGILVDGDTTIDNTITQNSIFANADLGIELAEGAHGGIAAPVITGVTVEGGRYFVQGTACPGCTVEMFVNPTDEGEGKQYFGDGIADSSGNIILEFTPFPFPYLTATSTDAALGTSEFSAVYVAPIIYKLYLPVTLK